MVGVPKLLSSALFLLLTQTLLLWGPSSCLYDDLDLLGKRCDSLKPCPGSLICVEAPLSADTRQGTCFNSEDAPSCAPGQLQCDEQGRWLESCEGDGHSRVVVQDCQPSALICSPDTLACAAPCAQDDECAAGDVCDQISGLCRPYPTCPDSSCPGLCMRGACVLEPDANVTSTSGVPEMDCYTDTVSDPPDLPEVCELTGRVNIFPSKSNSDQAIGLTAVLRQADYPYSAVHSMFVFAGADEKGYYSFPDVQTNRNYLVEIEAGTSQTGDQVISTITAGVAIRADQCLSGMATRGVSVVKRNDYQTYTGGTLDGLAQGRGMLIGRALDCNSESRRPLGNIRAGLAIPPAPPGRIYYFAERDILIPDLDLEATSSKGYYAAVGLGATRNTIGFAAQQGSSVIPLGAVDFFVGPEQAVVADLPLPQEQLAP